MFHSRNIWWVENKIKFEKRAGATHGAKSKMQAQNVLMERKTIF
jgi:hypothetical protein